MSKILPFSKQSNRDSAIENDIQNAIEVATQQYFDDCRLAVPGFIDRHFNYPGAIATNKVALGWDMLRAPANLLWAPFYAFICLIKFSIRHSSRFKNLYTWLDVMPAGFTTQVQRHISSSIRYELLSHGYSGRTLDDYLLDSLQAVYDKYNNKVVDQRRFHEMIEPLLDETLSEYQVTRTATADISNSLSCTILGAFAFQKFTPGGVGIGILVATWLSKKIASSQFVFGEVLGNIYYSLFPPEPSITVMVLSMVLVMSLLSAVAALSGLLLDPLQAASGLHRRRLHKMLNHLQQDLSLSTTSSYRPKDQFIARIMDSFDVIKSSLL
jgi:hypothetical protein